MGDRALQNEVRKRNDVFSRPRFVSFGLGGAVGMAYNLQHFGATEQNKSYYRPILPGEIWKLLPWRLGCFPYFKFMCLRPYT